MLRRTQEAMVAINRLLDLSMVSKRPVGAILDVILRVMELVDEESDESRSTRNALRSTR